MVHSTRVGWIPSVAIAHNALETLRGSKSSASRASSRPSAWRVASSGTTPTTACAHHTLVTCFERSLPSRFGKRRIRSSHVSQTSSPGSTRRRRSSRSLANACTELAHACDIFEPAYVNSRARRSRARKSGSSPRLRSDSRAPESARQTTLPILLSEVATWTKLMAPRPLSPSTFERTTARMERTSRAPRSARWISNWRLKSRAGSCGRADVDATRERSIEASGARTRQGARLGAAVPTSRESSRDDRGRGPRPRARRRRRRATAASPIVARST